MQEPLNETTVIDYLMMNRDHINIFTEGDKLTAEPIAEGNVNLLFRVYAENDPDNKSAIVKQALPYAWRYPDFKMPLDRSRIEYGVLSIEAKYCPDLVPEVYYYDEGNHILVIENLSKHQVMREGLMKQIKYPQVAQDMGRFFARTLFYTSDMHLTSAEKKALVPKFINPVLCKVQEDLVFTEPFIEHSNNHWSKPLNPIVEDIYADDDLRSEVLLLKERYMSHAQALIHNDAHTGSIMVNQDETKVLDPEFAFFGPMGHDIGTYLGNLAIGYAAQEYHAGDESLRTDYRSWILDSIRETWQVFETEFLLLWENQGNGEWSSETFQKKYIQRLLQDAAGFGGTEMMRRIIGMAHVHDFWTIEDEKIRARAESIGINIAIPWIKERHSLNSVEQLLDLVKKAKPDYRLG
jgi:5-methylthioribose kinase